MNITYGHSQKVLITSVSVSEICKHRFLFFVLLRFRNKFSFLFYITLILNTCNSEKKYVLLIQNTNLSNPKLELKIIITSKKETLDRYYL